MKMRRTLLRQEDGAEITSVGEDDSKQSIFGRDDKER